MRYLTAACPSSWRVLLVESGSRSVLETALPRLQSAFGSDAAFDLITCFPGAPSALNDAARTWRTQDFAKPGDRERLAQQIAASRPTVLALLCSGESIMLRWKWWLAWKIPAKVLIINENGDFFWLDSTNLRTLRRFAAARIGVSGRFNLETVGRAAAFPLVALYLVLYATIVHVRRALRMFFAHGRH